MAEELFFSLLTTTGAARLTNAVALDQSVDITKLAVGDGEAGAYYTPTEAQTALKNEVYRGTINNKYVHPTNANWVVFELAIPADEGPFTVREAGLFDDVGNLIGIAKLPESYKPALAQGSGKDLLIKFTLQTSNAAQVELFVDSAVILATHSKVEQDIAAHEALADPHDQYNVATATTNIEGKVELSDIPEAKAGSDATRAVTPAGLSGVLSDYRLRDMIERLLSSIADGNTNPAINVVPETYETTDGIDLGASSGVTHNASKATISNDGITIHPSAEADWEGDTVEWTFDGSSMAHNGTGESGMRLQNITFDGDFEVKLTVIDPAYTSVVGVYPITDDATFLSTGGGSYSGNMVGMTDSVWFHTDSGNSLYFAQSSGNDIGPASGGLAGGQEVTFRRIGDTYTLDVDDVLKYTWAFTSTAEVRLVIGSNNTCDFDAISWTVPGNPVAMTEVSPSIEAFTEPVSGYYLGFIEPVDAVVYGVDTTVDLSKDDGTTWEATSVAKIAEATITVSGTPTIVDIIYGEVDFVTNGDQTLRRRLQTVADKLIEVHASLFDAE